MAINEVEDESSEEITRRSGGKTIRIEDMTKTFNDGTVVAAENIDLTINPDEFVVLLGPSGCGKTTTLRCIAGLEIPNSGRILIENETVTEANPKDRDLAFVFQTIALFPHMSVRDNIRFGLDIKTDLSPAEKEKRVEEAADILGIPELLDRKPSALSGGQQQRVALGRAMVIEPVAFLLDEPFSALDANLRDQMQTEIKQLHRELGRAMIFVTHDQEEAMSLGDKIVVMNEGQIQQAGSPYEIYNDPINRFVAQFIGSPSINMFTCRVSERDGEIVLFHEVFTLSLSEEQSEALAEHVGSDLTVGLRPENLSLTDEGMFAAEITLIEPQGSQDVVFLERDGLELRATTDQGEMSQEGVIDISFSAEDIFAFDDSGERLL